MKHRPLLYIETSVFGFCFDTEPRNAAARRDAALELFEQVHRGVLRAATSPVTFTEIEHASEPLRSELVALLNEVNTLAVDRQEAERLALAYVREKAIPESCVNDARHVSYATIGRVDVLVSMNLRHLANEWAERSIGAVNLREGYQVIRIRTPEEVLKYED